MTNPQITARTGDGRFKPGVSGNPGGRPKRKPITDLLWKKLDELLKGDKDQRLAADAIADAIISHAFTGNSPYMKELMDRVEGKLAAELGAAPTEIHVNINLGWSDQEGNENLDESENRIDGF